MRHFVKSLGAHLTDTVTKVSEEFFHGAEPEIDGPGHDGSYVIEWDTAQAEGPRGERVPMQVVEDELRRAGARVIHAENRGSRYHVALQPGNKFLRRKALRKGKFLARRAKGLPRSGRKFIDLGPILAAIASNAQTLNHMLRPDTWRQGYDYVHGLIREGLDAVGPKSPETERSVRDAERQLMEAADDWFDNEVIPVVNQYHPDNVVGPKAQQLIAWIQRKLQGKSLPGRLGKSLTITFAKGSVLQGRKGRGWKRCHRQKFLPSDPLGLVPLLMNTSYQVIPLLVEGSIRQAADLIASALQRAGIGVEASDIKPLLEERQGQVGAGPRQLMEGLARDLNEAQGKALLRYRVKSLTGRRGSKSGGQQHPVGQPYQAEGGAWRVNIQGPDGRVHNVPAKGPGGGVAGGAGSGSDPWHELEHDPEGGESFEAGYEAPKKVYHSAQIIGAALRLGIDLVGGMGRIGKAAAKRSAILVGRGLTRGAARIAGKVAGRGDPERKQQVEETVTKAAVHTFNEALANMRGVEEAVAGMVGADANINREVINAASSTPSGSMMAMALMCGTIINSAAWAIGKARGWMASRRQAAIDREMAERPGTIGPHEGQHEPGKGLRGRKGRKAWHKDMDPAQDIDFDLMRRETQKMVDALCRFSKIDPVPVTEESLRKQFEKAQGTGMSGGKRLRRKSFRRGSWTQGR